MAYKGTPSTQRMKTSSRRFNYPKMQGCLSWYTPRTATPSPSCNSRRSRAAIRPPLPRPHPSRASGGRGDEQGDTARRGRRRADTRSPRLVRFGPGAIHLAHERGQTVYAETCPSTSPSSTRISPVRVSRAQVCLLPAFARPGEQASAVERPQVRGPPDLRLRPLLFQLRRAEGNGQG